MARYQNNYEHHEDTVKKVDLTKKDLDFLIDLQKEMNTQDNNSQADPRFWVIRQTEKRYRVEEADGYELVCDTESVAEGMTDILKYLKEEIIPEINEDYKDEYEYWIEDETKASYACVYRKDLEYPDDEYETWTLTSEEDIADFIEEHESIVGEHELVSYKNVEVNIPDTMFLTHRESELHLHHNAHNYHEDAHSYSMTAYRSPDVARLYEIIQTIDWTKLKEQVE